MLYRQPSECIARGSSGTSTLRLADTRAVPSTLAVGPTPFSEIIGW